jgi:hypothetical protein
MCKLFWILCANLSLYPGTSFAEKKKILVFENLKTDNPYLSVQIKEMYENAIKIAEEEFRKQAKSTSQNVALKVQFDTSGNVSDALKKAASPDVIAIVGLAFTGDAGIATRFAEEHKIPFIAPAASFDELFESSYSRSFGVSMKNVVGGLEHVLKSKNKAKEVSLVTASDSIYDQLYAKHLRANKDISVSKVHSFAQFESPAGKVFNDLRETAILTSYGHASVDTVLKSSQGNNKEVPKFLATSQWGYSAQFLTKVLTGFNGNISIVTDFYPLYQIPKKAFDDKNRLSMLMKNSVDASQNFRDIHLKKFKKEPFEFTYAIYDTLSFALSIGADESLRTSKDFHKKMLAERELAGASGPTVIKDGKFFPVIYVLDWTKNRFELREFSFDGAFWKINH